jgi:hypothetical protein
VLIEVFLVPVVQVCEDIVGVGTVIVQIRERRLRFVRLLGMRLRRGRGRVARRTSTTTHVFPRSLV